jgi:hypothetical protein
MNGINEGGTSVHENGLPLVAVVILNWNKPDLTERCLESVYACSYPAILPIVVDNGSTEDWSERFQTWFGHHCPAGVAIRYDVDAALSGGTADAERLLDTARRARLVVIRSHLNRGFTGGNNVATAYALARVARADYVFFLNNDAYMERNCLRHLVNAITKGAHSVMAAFVERVDDGFAFGGKFGSYPSLKTLFDPVFRLREASPRSHKLWVECCWVTGAAMLCSGEMLSRICTGDRGYWREELFMYFEEFDLCRRVNQQGGRVGACPSARVTHKEASSSGGRGSPLMFYYITRNPFHLARWYLPLALAPLWYAYHLSLCLARVGKRLLHRDFVVIRAIAAGVRDGFLLRTGKWGRHEVSIRRAARQPSPNITHSSPEAPR